MPNGCYIRPEGSAGPEGGREAPALRAGSGAALHLGLAGQR